MTGTAQLCAQEMELTLGDDDTEVETVLMDGLDASVFSRPGVFLICTSTYGQGDVPDNARALYEDLKAQQPNLAPVRYRVFWLVELFLDVLSASRSSWTSPSTLWPAVSRTTPTSERASTASPALPHLALATFTPSARQRG